MKKLLTGISTGITSALLFTPAAFAQVTIDPCATNGVNGVNAATIQAQLCRLNSGSSGNVIRNAIIAVLIIATLISLFFLIRGGISWILSGGDKAKVDASRQMLVAAIIGLIITFLAYFILSLVLQLFGLNFNNLVLPTLTN